MDQLGPSNLTPSGPPLTPSHPQPVPNNHSNPPFPVQQTGYQYYYGQISSPAGGYPVFHYPAFGTPVQAPVGTPVGTPPSRNTLQTMQPGIPAAASTVSQEQGTNSRKRRTRANATSNAQRSRRPRLDENGTTVPSSGGNVPTAAETCGVGAISPSTRRSASPSQNPALNSAIFRSKLRRDKQASSVASDVWFNLRPCPSKDRPPEPLPPCETLFKKRPKEDEWTG
ncbi:hypothetical protein F5880DRAFT_1619478 [Lentinula raphanica]|nr:hypothetical protein F5880DRAFT_1619478 [Lentinula raphanica]